MKIVFLKSNITKRGGLEKYTLRLANGFAHAGHDVTIVTSDYEEGALPTMPVKIVSVGNKTSLSLVQLIRFDTQCKRYIQAHAPDMVFGMERHLCPQTHYRAGNGCHAAYLDRRRLTDSWLKAMSFSFNPLHRLILDMEKRTFTSDCLQKLFVNSHMVEREIKTYYPQVDPQKIVVVHNGVEWYDLQKSFDEGLAIRDKVIKSLGLDPNVFQFLFVGNEYGRKGLHLLLDALAQLPKKSFQLTVIGKEREPEPFKQQAEALGLETQVKFIGQTTEMKPYYTAADALVIPSLYDPFANVTVEALAMGLRVISSSANGGSEVITTPELGSVFTDLKNPQELADQLNVALNLPKTKESATAIRQAVASLDFSNQVG
ncbi:MAG: glycosyltransferase family 4 protein, partial [Chlamydiales bacterium]|nr:glycosyltransferase family 4 protein [Chlamydiales bacterium]